MNRTLEGRVAVVTGSTSGIGKGIAIHFGALGARVLVHGNHIERARGVVQKIVGVGSEADAYIGDLTREDVCRGIMTFAAARFGQVDILVNNAADTSRGDVESTSCELWDRIMAVNLRAPFLCTQEAIRHMKPRGRGAIVNIGSVNAYIGLPELHPYSVSKGGLMTLTKNAASYLKQFRIRVNQINVGWTLTEGEQDVMRLEGRGETWVDDAVRTRPFGRLLLPEDVAYAAAYFASDESACVTGSVLDLEQYPIGAPASTRTD